MLWPSFAELTWPRGTKITARTPARAAYAAKLAAVLPVLAHARAVEPKRTACVTAAVMPVSLNDPVGFAPWCFSQS